MMMWTVTVQAQSRAPPCKAEHKTQGDLKLKALYSFQNYFSLGDFVTTKPGQRDDAGV